MKNTFLVFLFLFTFVSAYFNSLALADTTPQSFLPRPWAVGQTATYQIKTLNGQDDVDSHQITFSIVDQENINGVNYFWLEIVTSEGDNIRVIQKLQVIQPKQANLLKILAGNYSDLNVRRRIRKLDYKKSKRLSTVSEFEISPTPVVDDYVDSYEKVDWANLVDDHETTTVPAGSFETIKIHRNRVVDNSKTPDTTQQPSTTANYYCDEQITAQVPIWGIAQITFGIIFNEKGATVHTIDLVSYSDTGVISQISEKPTFISLSSEQQTRDNLLKKSPSVNQGLNLQ